MQNLPFGNTELHIFCDNRYHHFHSCNQILFFSVMVHGIGQHVRVRQFCFLLPNLF